jgi:hypothetical protein
MIPTEIFIFHTKPSLYPHLTVHAAFIGRLQLQGCDGAAAAAMAAGRGRCGWIWMAAPRSGHGCGPAAPEWRESLLAKPWTSLVLKIWLCWMRLFFRVCEIATPIGLDDARTHVEEFFVGSSIHGDNLTCRLARKLRQVQERFEAARLEDMAANCYRGEETLDLVPVPWRKRAVRALQCASVADAGRGRGMKTTMSLQKSTAQARRLWSSKAVRHGLVG